jgi:hypothetical protein
LLKNQLIIMSTQTIKDATKEFFRKVEEFSGNEIPAQYNVNPYIIIYEKLLMIEKEQSELSDKIKGLSEKLEHTELSV